MCGDWPKSRRICRAAEPSPSLRLCRPPRRTAARAREIAGKGFFEIHVATQIEVCEERDPKNHYRKARSGSLADFTGVTSQYEEPLRPELRIDTSETTTDQAIAALDRLLRSSGVFLSR